MTNYYLCSLLAQMLYSHSVAQHVDYVKFVFHDSAGF